jgi:hypothetical protein
VPESNEQPLLPDTKVNCDGSVSLITTLAALLGPKFCNDMLKATFEPNGTVGGLAFITSVKSAVPGGRFGSTGQSKKKLLLFVTGSVPEPAMPMVARFVPLAPGLITTTS